MLQNYNEKLEKVRAILGCWKFRRLSLIGKITVIKSLAASQLVYILSSLGTNEKVLKKINKIFFNFLWSGKGDKIKRNVVINDIAEGGIKMIDIFSFNKSLKATWIKKYLDINNRDNWKTFIDLELQQYGGDVLLRGNLNKKDISGLTAISCPFVKEILEIWSEVFFEAKVSSEDHLLSLPLWYNSLIRIGNRPVFYKDWYAKGVTKVEHLWDNSTSFLTWTDFQNKYNLKIRFLDYFGIVSAIKSLHKNEVYHKYECMFTKFLECAKPNRLVYKKLISFKSVQPHSCQEK